MTGRPLTPRGCGAVRRVLAAAGALAVAGLCVVIAPPASALAATAPGVATGDPSLTLLGQSPYVQSGQDLRLQLAVAAPSPSTIVEVLLGSRILTRSGFDADARYGARSSSTGEYVAAPASSLPADPAGGVDIDIPVNPTSGGTTGTFAVDQDTSGVYPLTVELLGSGYQQLGQALTTFMVYASPAAVAAVAPGASGSGLPRLDVALSVPVRASPVVGPDGHLARLSSSTSAALGAEVAALAAHATVPVTIDATPATLDSLAAGGVAGRSSLAELADLAGGADQVGEEPYAPASLPGLTAAGLGSEVTAQLAAGDQALATDLGHPAAGGTLTVDGALDGETLAQLSQAGIDQVVAPAADLSAVPESLSQTTVASPTGLAVRGGATARVVAIDAGLQAHFVDGSDDVLEANRLLAELAMIQLETPGEHRGVAVVPPPGWTPDPTFITTVLTGLTGNPLLDPVTTTGLFSLPTLGGSSPVTRSPTSSRPTVAAFADPGQVRAARQAVGALSSVYPPGHTPTAALGQRLLLAESAELTATEQGRLIGAVASALTRLRSSISLPGASVTLTARDGEVPITVVAAAGSTGARVQLRLSSEKVSFPAFRPAGGTCTSPSSGVERCQLTLTSEATTLKVPVIARASGVFTLAVSLTSPDGSVTLAETHDTVRSTAFSGVGVVLMVVAGLGLAYWWIRNIRHGRRARDLVEPSEDDEGPLGAGDGSSVAGAGLGPRSAFSATGSAGSAGAVAGEVGLAPGAAVPGGAGPGGAGDELDGVGEDGSWLDEDPVIAEFFSSPAPSYPPSHPPRPGPGGSG